MLPHTHIIRKHVRREFYNEAKNSICIDNHVTHVKCDSTVQFHYIIELVRLGIFIFEV